MTLFIKARTTLHEYISKNLVWIQKLFIGLGMLLSLWTIQNNLGYSTFLSSGWVIVFLAIVGAFLPMSANALVLEAYIILQLLTLSAGIAGVALLLFALFSVLAKTYQAKYIIHIPGITVCYELHIPYAAPLLSGLFGSM
ncbi:MAG: hypothetical protein K6F00_03120, partial [Lachnospiraceae bacterium]|nr:hypothetical protein [Lachnospiraceae bacterium]